MGGWGVPARNGRLDNALNLESVEGRVTKSKVRKSDQTEQPEMVSRGGVAPSLEISMLLSTFQVRLRWFDYLAPVSNLVYISSTLD